MKSNWCRSSKPAIDTVVFAAFFRDGDSSIDVWLVMTWSEKRAVLGEVELA